MDIQPSSPTQITISPPPAASGKGEFFRGESPGFADLIDTINPLEHLPVVSNIYHAIRGENNAISPAATIIGGALFGGVFGLVAGLADVIFKQATGHSVIGSAVAAFSGDSSKEAVQYAARGGKSVNLGDFSGDIKLALRTRSYEDSAPDVQYAQNDAVPVPQEVAQAVQVEQVAQAETPMQMASMANMVSPAVAVDTAQRAKNNQVLSLFGDSQGPVTAYQKANMRAYLKDASTNLVM